LPVSPPDRVDVGSDVRRGDRCHPSAVALPAPIGTGVVVIDTNLTYQGAKAAGTGMVLTPSGEVLTNNHVIRGATSIKVVVPGTGHSYQAKVVGYDVSADVAVLQATAAADLKTIATDSSSRIKVGEAVAAFGNAGGTGSLTSSGPSIWWNCGVWVGIVTALRRSITVSDDQGGSEALADLVETNAPLQPGDSGGPLLNAAGNVVAMDTTASLSYDLFAGTHGYAIPINRALTIANQIESGHGPTAIHLGDTAFLGVAVTTRRNVRHDTSTRSAATITDVARGGPAAAAGLAAGDSILAVAGRKVSTPTELGSLILSRKPGAQVSVKYTDRSGATHTADVTLASGPPQ
jgi:S1-C subfamily serine protease